MSANKEFDSLLAAARAEQSAPVIQCGDADAKPRMELFHAGLSICSQKVRVVLAEKGEPYLSHELSILAQKGIYSDEYSPAENYRPGYVRLRMYIGAAQGLTGNLAQQHTLRTAVDTEGFDPCVVPLLIDNERGQGIVDSAEIIKYLDNEVAGAIKLIPDDAAQVEAVMRQVKIVDGTPHPGILYGFHDNDPRPDFIKHVMQDVYDVKVGALNQLIEQNKDDSALVKAYKAKIAKEQAGKKIHRDPQVTLAIRNEFQDIITELDAQLVRQGDQWICGKDFTLADAVWGVSLYRIHWVGHAYLWKDYPRVREYAHRCYKRPSIWDDVINWPSPMPESPHTGDVLGAAA